MLLKGTVGAGKTTFAHALQNVIQTVYNGVCIVEGTDKYCKNGVSTSQAVNFVKSELQRALTLDKQQLVVVVIDCCNERQGAIFDTRFDGWKIVPYFVNFIPESLNEYLAWSLRNVLRRNKPGADDMFYLNPATATVKTCIDVHRKKANALFGAIPANMNNLTPVNALVNIDPLATNYAAKLIPVDEAVNRFVTKEILK